MIEVLRQMLFGVTAAALFSVVMLTLTRRSALYEIVRLATGMLMIAALLRPLGELHLPSFAALRLGGEKGQAVQTQQRNEAFSRAAFGAAVAQAIEKQAAAQGIICGVTADMDTADGTMRIRGVQIRSGTLTVEKRKKLDEIVTRFCGASVSRSCTEEAGWQKNN